MIITIGKRYRIIYDDKGFKPVKKEGKVISKEGSLIKLESGEVLNSNYILRAVELR